MSDRYNRPRTPPSPPPSASSRKTSSRGLPSVSSAKSVASKSYRDHPYEKYDKDYKSSANYQSSSSSSSSKQYSESKYKTDVKSNEKVVGSKYASKSVNYDDNFKLGSESQYSSQRYTDRETGSAKYSERGRYAVDKYPPSASASTSQYNNKKFDDYATYPDKSGRYPKQEAGSYFGSSYDSYGSYEGYGADRQRGGTYANDRLSIGTSGFVGDKFGGGSRPGGASYAGGKTGYGGDKFGRGGGYGGDKLAGGGLGFADSKSAGTARSGLYDEDRRPYRSYSPSRTARSPLRSYSGSYDDYGYASSSRTSDKQYLDRYVIGDSVVYGPPGQYPRNLTHASVSPGRRPPSPPSPPMMQSRGFNRYSAASPRRYSSGRRSASPTSSSYQNLASTSRRPPSPPSKRPPSPDSVYIRGRDRSYDATRSKERYHSRSPLREARSLPDRRESDRARVDERNRREDDRRLGSREKSSASDGGKRARMGDQRSSSYRGAGDLGTYPKDSYASSTRNHKDERNQQSSPNRGARRDSRNEGRDRGRRLEDRLGVNPSSGGNRRSPVNRPRMGRNAASPRDGNNKKPRRPDDLRLWIESRKNDMGKKGISQSRGRPAGKGMARSGGDRSKMLKRSRLGDPKRRLGGKAKRAGGGGSPMKRNKILNKYRRLAARRGVRSGGGGRDGGGGGGGGGGRNNSNRANRDAKGMRKGNGGGDGENDNDSNKPGSTASIRRVIKKPKRVSQVNNLEIKPRIMGKPIKKLLKDPKEENDESSKYQHSHNQRTSHHSSRETSREDEKLVTVKVESMEGGSCGTGNVKSLR